MGVRRYRCPHCGANLRPEPGHSQAGCDYCGTLCRLELPDRRHGKDLTLPVAVAAPSPKAAFGLSIALSLVVLAVAGAITARAARPTGAGVVPRAPAVTHIEVDEPALALHQKRVLALDRVVGDCLNGLVPRIVQSHQRYTSWVDVERGPSANDRHVRGLYTFPDPMSCAEAAADSIVTSAGDEFAAASRAFADAASALHPIVEEAARYYDRERFRDDDFARGQALHVALLDAFGEAEMRARALTAHADRLSSEVAAELRPILEETGTVTAIVQLESQVVARKLSEHATVTWRELDAIDVDALRADVERYEKLVNALEGADDVDTFYRLRSDTLLDQALALMRSVRDGPRWSSGEQALLSRLNPSRVSGTPEAVLSAYNDVARHSSSPKLPIVLPVLVRDEPSAGQ